MNPEVVFNASQLLLINAFNKMFIFPNILFCVYAKMFISECNFICCGKTSSQNLFQSNTIKVTAEKNKLLNFFITTKKFFLISRKIFIKKMKLVFNNLSLCTFAIHITKWFKKFSNYTFFSNLYKEVYSDLEICYN